MAYGAIAIGTYTLLSEVLDGVNTIGQRRRCEGGH